MAKKKKPDIKIDYRADAEPKALTGEIPVFCAFDELVDIVKMVENPLNPNTHSIEQITLLSQIIKATGWRQPITVSNLSGFIVKGHGRLAAAKLLKLDKVPVDFQNYSNQSEEYADLIADNRIAELSEIDNTKLTDILQELDTGEIPIELTGYTEEDLSSLLDAITGADDTEDDKIDDVSEELPRLVISKAGDLWHVGRHRIICGDSTDEKVIERLMQGDKAQVVNTDPPYGVSYDVEERDPSRYTKKWDTIKDDNLTKDDLMVKLLIPAFRNMVKYSKDDAAFYIWHACMNTIDFWDSATRVGLMVKQIITWVKNNFAIGRSDYQWNHEPCLYAEKAGQTAKWCGDRSQTTTWKVIRRGKDDMATVLTGGIVVTDGEGNKVYIAEKPPKNKKIRYVRLSDGTSVTIMAESSLNTVWEVSKDTKADHPTQKPVELATRAIENSSEPGDIVMDLFGGSHSTMIAAEITGREARICELEPKYVDVGLLRYVKLKGLNGIIKCERDGKEYDFLELCQHIADENGISISGLIDGTYSTEGDMSE